MWQILRWLLLGFECRCCWLLFAPELWFGYRSAHVYGTLVRPRGTTVVVAEVM
jgi:hypothetical protein